MIESLVKGELGVLKNERESVHAYLKSDMPANSYRIDESLTPDLASLARSLAIAEVQKRFAGHFGDGDEVAPRKLAGKSSSSQSVAERSESPGVRARVRAPTVLRALGMGDDANHRSQLIDRIASVLDTMRNEHRFQLQEVEKDIAAGVHAQVNVLKKAVESVNQASSLHEGVTSKFASIQDDIKSCRGEISEREFAEGVTLRNVKINTERARDLLRAYGSVPERIAALEQRMNANSDKLYEIFVEWHEMKTLRSCILNNLENMEESMSKEKVKYVLGEHFRCVSAFGKLLWGEVFGRIRRAFDVAQYEPGKLTEAALIVQYSDESEVAERARLRRRLEDRGLDPRDHLAAISPNKMRAECIHVFETRARQRLNDILPIDTSDTEFINAATTLLFDLRILREDVSPCVPSDYGIIPMHKALYDERFVECVDRAMTSASELKGQMLLSLIGWMEQYQDEVAQLGLPPHPTLVAHADTLMEIYLSGSLSRMRGWLATIIDRRDKVEFRGKMCYTVAPDDVFGFLDKDMRVVCEEGCVRGVYLVRYAKQVAAVILEEFVESMQSRIVGSDTELEELCAIVSDCSRSQDLCSEVLSFVANHLGSEHDHDTSIAEAFEEVQSSFLRLSIRCIHAIADDILKSLEGVVGDLFGDEWERGDFKGAVMIKSTLIDYFDDPDQGIRGWLSDAYFFGKLCAIVLDRIIAAYMNRLLSVAGTFASVPRAAARMKSDADELESCFAAYISDLKYGAVRDGSVVTEKFGLIRLCSSFLISPLRIVSSGTCLNCWAATPRLFCFVCFPSLQTLTNEMPSRTL